MYATFLNALERPVEHVPIIDISVIMESATFLPPPPQLFLLYSLFIKKNIILPVKPAASAMRKVHHDIRKNNAVSSRGKSLIFVNLVN